MIWWNRQSSDDVRVRVEHYPNRIIPQRKMETVSVPGRSGDLLFMQDAFENYEQPYDIYISAEQIKLSSIAHKVAEWLLQSGYCRLEDSYEPDYFRMAYYSGNLDIENIMNHYGRATITFNCMPQRYLKSGEYEVACSNGQILVNPTAYDAKPLIRVAGNGNGVINVGNQHISLNGIDGYIYIDSDRQDAYKDSTNCNNKMVGEFPTLQKSQAISWSGGISGVIVVPRWFTI